MQLPFSHLLTKLTQRKIVRSLIFASVIIFTFGLVKAEVLFDSTSNPVFDLDAVTSGVTLNASFSTKEYPFALKEVALLWRRSKNDNGLIRLNLLSDNSATPGTALEMLAEIDAGALPMGEQLLTIPIKMKTPLNAKTRYWIQIKANGAAGAMAYSRKHDGEGVPSEFYLNMYGLHSNAVTGPYIFKIDGNPQKN